MKLIYVAGPFRVPSDPTNQWRQWENVRRAAALALEVWKRGAACICPHLNTAFFEGSLPADVWIQGDLAMVRRCDAVLLTPDWEQSVGARGEAQLAQNCGIPVLLTLDELDRFLHPTAQAGPDGHPY